MRIQHNIAALNSYRNYSANNSAVAKNLEKLSSGYKINRAGDDAAGLAISEKMRAQITGLETAQKNAKDGVSLVQTAEGALTEVHDMMNRMYELAEQSANGTFDNEVDRANLQKEVSALKTEIDRIADSSNFNGINLLDGSLAAKGSSSASVDSSKMVATVNSTIATLKTGVDDAAAVKGKYTADLTGIAGTASAATTDLVRFTVEYTDTDGNAQTKTLTTASLVAGAQTDNGLSTAIATAINADKDLNKLFTATGTNANAFNLEATQAGTNGAKFTGIKVESAVQADGAAGTASVTKPSSIAVSTATAATDKTTKNVIDFGAATTNLSATNTITVGDKTYEFVAANGDVTSVAKGNVAVVLGTDKAGSIGNLVKALNANGVKSAKADISFGVFNIKIGDLDEIKAGDKAANVETTSSGITISSVNPDKATSVFTAGVAAKASSTQTLTLTYLDSDGKEQTAKVQYNIGTTVNNTAVKNADAIKSAIAADATLSQLFEVSASTASSGTTQGQVTITAKTAGANGAKLTSVSSSDINSQAISELNTTKVGRDAGQSIALSDKISNGDKLTVNGQTFQFVDANNLDKVEKGNVAVLIDSKNSANTAVNLNLAMKQNGVDADFNAATNSFFVANDAAVSSKGGLTLQIGDTAESFNQLTVSVDDMHAASLGIGDVDISTQDGAKAAMDKIKSAINSVSSTRGDLGATQNRLEHTINNLSVMTENITDAESSIRDVDVAKEMMEYTKNNILVQSAQAMLAQANQLPQGVLQLLQ